MKQLAVLIFTLLFFPTPSMATELDPTQARTIGYKIWQNEGLGKTDNLTVWNKGEDFPSFGIGHFIWYPAGTNGPFKESFPALIQYLHKTIDLPDWLNQAAPWPNRAYFYLHIDSPKLKQLRAILQNSIPQQTEFIIQRMEQALPKILNSIPQENRQLIKHRFYTVAKQANGLYALIDYINFKGEGISLKERYQGEGWGLLQVLQNMDDQNPDIMVAFVESADFVLSRRVNNASRNERVWLLGWRKRLKTYLP